MVLPKEEKLETQLKLPDFSPFWREGLFLFQSTETNNIIIRKGILPLSAETYTGMDVLVGVIELGCVKLPIHSVYLNSDLVEGMVNVRLCEKLPVDEVDVIFGNDLAGGKVFPPQLW